MLHMPDNISAQYEAILKKFAGVKRDRYIFMDGRQKTEMA